MMYALTHRLPRDLRNEIQLAIREAVQNNQNDALRHCPGIIYACDATRGTNYYCLYCPEGRVYLHGSESLHRRFNHYENSCIQNPHLQDGDIVYGGGSEAFCGQ